MRRSIRPPAIAGDATILPGFIDSYAGKLAGLSRVDVRALVLRALRSAGVESDELHAVVAEAPITIARGVVQDIERVWECLFESE